MLEINNIFFKHRNPEAEILRGVSFRVETGHMNTLLGPNGSGKTTLFKCIAGLWRHYEGAITCNGNDITSLSPEQRARILAVVPQEHEPPFPYTVFDAVLMGRASHVSLFSSPSPQDYEETETAIETLGISHLRERPYTKLSGGERQLVLIARALAQEAPLLLLDEPTSHLDFRNQILILNKVREIIRQKGLTALMTLHDPNLAMQFSDNIVMINGGHIISQGLPHEVLTGDNLKMMYGIDVSVISHNGTKVICPQGKQ
ncbi:MAG: ABC transporter ATP-binding protein [Syntrophaceae bacterium]